MSKKLSFRGTLPIGEQEIIRLKTNNGKTGYKITKFQIITTDPTDVSYGLIAKVTKVEDTNINATIDFTDSDLIAIAYSDANQDFQNGEIIIFDNEVVNQNLFINITDSTGGTTPCNYYLELEAMPLTDLEATKLTLQSIRQVTAPQGNV